MAEGDSEWDESDGEVIDVDGADTRTDEEDPPPDAASPYDVAECAAIAEHLEKSETLLSAFRQAMDVLNECGAVTAVHHLKNEERKELRRQRLAAKEKPAVAGALAQIKVARAAEERRERLMVQDMNKRQRELQKTKLATEEAEAKLSKKKKDLMSVEAILETRHALKRYSPDTLGQSKKNCGGAAGRKLRFEVLDRMAVLGTGLSSAPEKRLEMVSEAWDAKMCEEHTVQWGDTFCGWMQKVLHE